MHRLNSMKIHNQERLKNLLERKETLGRSVITPANHKSYFDDPVLIAALHKFSWRDGFKIRWAMGADEILFALPVLSKFFAMGQTVPVVRGDGIHQKCVEYFLHLLNTENVWIKIFPEGRIAFGDKEWVKFRWGIGRLVSEAEMTPIVLPYWHCGMEKILPVDHIRSQAFPRLGQKITVVFGKELDFRDDLIDMRNREKSLRSQRIFITSRIEEEMKALKEEALQLHYSRWTK